MENKKNFESNLNKKEDKNKFQQKSFAFDMHSSLVECLATLIFGKKLSQPLLLHFPFGMGTYVHHTKYYGLFMNLPVNEFFIRLDLYQFPLFKGGIPIKTGSLEDSLTPPNILHGGHKYPYQMENAIKVVGIVFSKHNLG